MKFSIQWRFTVLWCMTENWSTYKMCFALFIGMYYVCVCVTLVENPHCDNLGLLSCNLSKKKRSKISTNGTITKHFCFSSGICVVTNASRINPLTCWWGFDFLGPSHLHYCIVISNQTSRNLAKSWWSVQNPDHADCRPCRLY